jgi:hypothetical protein
MEDTPKITITTKARLTKYDVGADPITDKPIEVVEQQKVLTGQEAIDFIASLNGGATDGTN